MGEPMKTDFGALSKKMLDTWARLQKQDEERAAKFVRRFLDDKERALESQMERYEAAINGSYVPEPKVKSEPVTIRFKRPIPFEFKGANYERN